VGGPSVVLERSAVISSRRVPERGPRGRSGRARRTAATPGARAFGWARAADGRDAGREGVRVGAAHGRDAVCEGVRLRDAADGRDAVCAAG
jgi:hypothetical protein